MPALGQAAAGQTLAKSTRRTRPKHGRFQLDCSPRDTTHSAARLLVPLFPTDGPDFVGPGQQVARARESRPQRGALLELVHQPAGQQRRFSLSVAFYIRLWRGLIGWGAWPGKRSPRRRLTTANARGEAAFCRPQKTPTKTIVANQLATVKRHGRAASSRALAVDTIRVDAPSRERQRKLDVAATRSGAGGREFAALINQSARRPLELAAGRGDGSLD